jgi:hypothetical protein
MSGKFNEFKYGSILIKNSVCPFTITNISGIRAPNEIISSKNFIT